MSILSTLRTAALGLLMAGGLAVAALPAVAADAYTKGHPVKGALVLDGTRGDKSI